MNAERFVREYQEAWATGSPEAFRRLWHPDGILEHPTLDRPIQGRFVPELDRRNREVLPDLDWSLLSWADAGETVFLEWECKAHFNGELISWRGVDKMTLRDERIQAEVVYSDTLPLWAMLDPSMKRGALIDAGQLEAKAAEGSPGAA